MVVQIMAIGAIRILVRAGCKSVILRVDRYLEHLTSLLIKDITKLNSGFVQSRRPCGRFACNALLCLLIVRIELTTGFLLICFHIFVRVLSRVQYLPRRYPGARLSTGSGVGSGKLRGFGTGNRTKLQFGVLATDDRGQNRVQRKLEFSTQHSFTVVSYLVKTFAE